MISFDKEYFNIGYLDTLSYKQTVIHRIDPVIKLVVTLVFILAVVSFPKYEVAGMLPFFLFPVFIISAGDIPVAVVLKKIVVVSPFVLLLGIFNPIMDTRPLYDFMGISVSGGWVSYASIILKFVLTISSALLLIATTSFPGICSALERLKMPKIFVVQLLFLYRYIFVLAEETMRIVRARNMRTFGRGSRDIKMLVNIIGVLLIRSIERSERIYQSICSRGFDGQIRMLKDFKIGPADICYAIISITLFFIFRQYDIPGILGGLFI